ncbi:hypothetical protein L207DRAFT_577485 [Hyaloscypha variabilis F]|uniref:CENP-V/GFA domain-containing protein n=1 Tax=Hyaloscypha variabilis (strain UAMH 11265 / GT02V1 / F) TaxID=1149755 RepID=A0A2J6S796_HYAVF|nr:hypothetical protein L207DRAFT_577485 [Hyaloscypha variabilis F]
MDTPLPEPKNYDGNCHCGAFKFTVKLPSKPYHTCDCSICTKNGYIGMWPIADEDLTIHQGKGSLTEYQFANKYLTHFFCPTCGSSVMGRTSSPQAGNQNGINMRMLKNFNEYLNENKHDNAPFNFATVEPKYQPPPFPSHPDADRLQSDERIYNGNCHCGAVAYAVKTKSLEEQKNGDLWIYPLKTDVVVQGGENLTGYAFLSKDSLHSFCKTCGVSVLVKVVPATETNMPINVRTIDGIDIPSLKMIYYNGAKNDPQYVV